MGDINEIKVMIENMQSNMVSKASIESLAKKTDKIDKSISEIKSLHQELGTKCEVMSVEIRDVKSELARLQDASRKKNFLIFNIPDTEEINKDLFDSVMNILVKATVQLPDYCIDDIFRLGKIKGKRPVLVKLLTARHKSAVFKHAATLRSLGHPISDDLTPEERDKRKLLLSLCQKKREGGQEAKLKGNKVYIDGKLISEKRLSGLLASSSAPASAENNLPTSPNNDKTPRRKPRTPRTPSTVKKNSKERSSSASSGSGSGPLGSYFNPLIKPGIMTRSGKNAADSS